MTPREKILESGLKNIRKKLKHYKDLNRPDDWENTPESYSYEMAIKALNDADKIKDGPSEEDKDILNDYLKVLDGGKILSPSRVGWVALKLKKEWG